MFSATDKIAIFGMSGSGKSTLGRLIQRAYPRVVIIDRLREYGTRENPDPKLELFTDPRRFLYYLHENATTAKFRAAFQFGLREDRHSAIFEELLYQVYEIGHCALVIEEVHNFCTAAWMPPALKEIILTGRHRRVGVIATSQRPQEVSKTLISQCQHVFAGLLSDDLDLGALRGRFGSRIEEARALPKGEFLHWRPALPIQRVKNR